MVLCVAHAVHGDSGAPAPANQVVDGYAAIVNGSVITVGDVMKVLEPMDRQLRRMYKQESKALQKQRAQLYDEALETLIGRRLILDAFAKQETPLPERVVDQQIQEIIHSRFKDDRDLLHKTLMAGQLTMEEWRAEMRDEIIVSLMIRREVKSRVRVSPQAAREAYDAEPQTYRVPSKIRIRLIGVPSNETGEARAAKRARAEELRAALEKDEDFARAAAQGGAAVQTLKGGMPFWIAPPLLHEELAQAAAAMKPGTLSDVIEAEDGFYVLKLEERQEGGQLSFDEAKPAIENALQKKEHDRLYKEWIARLRQQSYVKVF